MLKRFASVLLFTFGLSAAPALAAAECACGANCQCASCDCAHCPHH